MNRNDPKVRQIHPQGSYYIVGRGRPVPVSVLSTLNGTVKVLRHDTHQTERVTRDELSPEPRRFNAKRRAARVSFFAKLAALMPYWPGITR